MKKGFVFDLDGVITDTAKFHYIAWKELGHELGIEIDLQFNEQLKGISRMDSLERILVHGGRENDFTAEQKEELAAKKNQHYVTLLQKLTPEDLLPGVKDFLDQAQALGIPCAIASASKKYTLSPKRILFFKATSLRIIYKPIVSTIVSGKSLLFGI